MRELMSRSTRVIQERLHRYLFNFETQERPGLLVVKHERTLAALRGTLDQNELRESTTWWSLLNNLNSRESTFIVLDGALSAEVYDIIEQYESRRGTINVVDQKTREVQSARVNPRHTRLLLVTTERDLPKIEAMFPIRERVGLTEVL